VTRALAAFLGALVSLSQTSAVESDRRCGDQTGPCSLVDAGAFKPVSE
jgi:hypothetical protein